MEKIKKLSKYLIYLFNVVMFALPVLIILKWLFIETDVVIKAFQLGIPQGPITTSEGVINFADVKWSLVSKAIGFLADCVGLLPFYLGIFVMKALFKNYYEGQIFSSLNAHRYNQLGRLFLIEALVANPFYDMLISLAATFNNPPGQRYISVSFGTPSLEAVFCGVVIFVISLIMKQASEMNDELKHLV